MQNISGFGLKVQLVASSTFPAGVTLDQFADDADPFDLPSIQLNDKALGLNGDMVTWSKATAITVTLNVIPGGDDDRNLQALANNNRVSRGRQSALDVITMTGIYPDGHSVTLANGIITDGMPGNSVASAGRLKSKTYVFAFESNVGA